MKDYDVVVAGAGPAGSMAALHAAKGGLSVLLLEKRAEIGAPKRCAEGVSLRRLREVGIEPDRQWISSEIIGTTIPKWFGGFNNTFTYKNWDLNIFLRFSGGNYIFNHQRINMLSMGFYNNSTEILGRWQSPENPGDGQTPKLYYNKTSQVSYTNSSRWVEKGDFLKIQDISLGYSFPYRICQKMLIQKLRLYIQAQNLATFSTYSGLDPESYTSALGIDRSGEPQQMQFLFGLSIGF